MGYISLTFVLILLVSLFFYYILPKKTRWVSLLIASVVFYLTFSIKNIIFLLFVSILTFISAKLLEKMKYKKTILFGCILIIVGLWSLFKLLPWTLTMLEIYSAKFGFNFSKPKFNLLSPIGISYFTLQAIGYMVDVYKNKIKSEKNFFKYLLFLSYFPSIVQGPISRYDKLMPELLNKKKYSYDSIRCGIVLILFGLVKKLVIADRIGILVNYCFNQYENLYGVILYLGAVAFSIQLYMDFSGCVDISRGVSKLFRIELINNFNRPYLAHSIKDFWSRWHISLSTWLKDYIYIPLGGNRKGKLRKYINLIITFLVSGIWHGAGFSFIVWGLLHAIYQIIGELLIKVRIKFKNIIGLKEDSLSDKIYKTIITFNLVTFAWIFFRCISLKNALVYIKNMFIKSNIWVLFDGSLYNNGISLNYFNLLLVHIFIIWLIERKFSKQEKVVSEVLNMHIILRWLIYWILIFDILLFGAYGSGYDLSGFMYGGF